MTYTTPQYIQEEIKAVQSFSDTTYPSLQTVQRWIDEIESQVDTIAGKSFGEVEYTQYIDYDGEDRIVLDHSPVISVTSVKSSPYTLGDSAYPSWETKTANTDYALYDKRGELLVLPSWTPNEGPKSIEIVYTAGYSEIPGNVQFLATKLVAKRVLDAVISKDVSERQSGKSISVGSISIVKPSDVGVNQLRKLDSDVDMLKSEVLKGTSAHRFNY